MILHLILCIYYLRRDEDQQRGPTSKTARKCLDFVPSGVHQVSWTAQISRRAAIAGERGKCRLEGAKRPGETGQLVHGYRHYFHSRVCFSVALLPQKYRDESESRLSAYHSSLEEYVKKVDPSIFKAINIQRKAKGQRRINTPAAVTSKIPKRPLSPYIQSVFITFLVGCKSTRHLYAISPHRFTLEYRRNMTATPPSDLHGLDLGRWYSKQCGQQWKSMTEEQKKVITVQLSSQTGRLTLT